MTGLHYLSDSLADYIHFSGCKPITARKVTCRAGGSNISLYVGQGVVDPIKASIFGCCATIGARLLDHFQYFSGRQVAGVYPLVGLPQECRAPLWSLTPPLHPGLPESALFWSEVRPPLLPPVTALLPLAVTFSALVSQAKRAARVLQEYFWSCQQLAIAAVADAVHWFCGYAPYPAHINGNNMAPIPCKHGPHWELPWAEYPA